MVSHLLDDGSAFFQRSSIFFHRLFSSISLKGTVCRLERCVLPSKTAARPVRDLQRHYFPFAPPFMTAAIVLR